jgi:DNA polymerase III sliding clamp (beta) subunit (PCNA family)
MTFNHRYLTDLLESYDGEDVVLRVADDARTVKTPLLLEDPSAGFVALVQQMRGL